MKQIKLGQFHPRTIKIGDDHRNMEVQTVRKNALVIAIYNKHLLDAAEDGLALRIEKADVKKLRDMCDAALGEYGGSLTLFD